MPHCDPVGLVHSLESFGSVDGPGVRFVVFLQGCALRCKYCHNPETWSAEGGTEWSPEKLFQHVWRYRNYWGKKGGITVSGGEPLRQMDFLTKFFQLARAKGVHTALDTAGQPFQPDDPAYLAAFDTLMASTSLVILDLKEIDPEKHRQLTGRDNANILAMARHISDLGVPLWIRHVLVPGLTDDEEGLRRTADFIRSLKTVQRVEVLPYHTLGLFKWQNLGIPYPLDGVRVPTAEEIAAQLDMEPARVRELIQLAQDPISLETPVGEEEDAHLEDFIQDEEAGVPVDEAGRELLRRELANVLKSLTPREERVLTLRFGLEDGHPRTLEEVGKEFNVTRERIRQIEAKALRKLRHPSRSRKLKDYLE